MANKAAVDRRVAQALLAEMLSELGVVQDESTADRLLNQAQAIDRRNVRGVGEVITVTWPTSTGPGDATPVARTLPRRDGYVAVEDDLDDARP